FSLPLICLSVHLHLLSSYLFFFLLLIPPPPRSTLFPYTTLFRSYSQLNPVDPEESVAALKGRLRPILARGREVGAAITFDMEQRSEEHTSELQSLAYLVCRLLLEKKKINKYGELSYSAPSHRSSQ